MVAVVAGSIKFTMPDAGLEGRKPRPDLFINSSHVVCHLTHGFNSAGVPNNEFGSVNNGSIDRAISEAAWPRENPLCFRAGLGEMACC